MSSAENATTFCTSCVDGVKIIISLVLACKARPTSCSIRFGNTRDDKIDFVDSSLDDVNLIQRVARGDQQAFLALYDRYASRVHALTLHVLAIQCWLKKPLKIPF